MSNIRFGGITWFNLPTGEQMVRDFTARLVKRLTKRGVFTP